MGLDTIGFDGAVSGLTPWSEGTVLETLAPEFPVEDLQEFLACFNTSQSAVFTLYANQPIKNSSASVSGGGDVGHAFISISQNGKTSTFGFYPSGEGLKSAYGPSVIGNNGGDSFDVSLSVNISGTTLASIINKATNYPNDYDVYNYNCTDYALELANLAGMDINNAWGVYPTGLGGDNPGKLGQILRTRTGANTNGGIAPSKSNDCN